MVWRLDWVVNATAHPETHASVRVDYLTKAEAKLWRRKLCEAGFGYVEIGRKEDPCSTTG